MTALPATAAADDWSAWRGSAATKIFGIRPPHPPAPMLTAPPDWSLLTQSLVSPSGAIFGPDKISW
jgi:hypothetical protein